VLAVASASADGGWLDAAPTGWNQANAPIPTAPPLRQSQVRCQNQERAATETAETQLRAQGWRLESYWPAAEQGNLTLVTALADYDGMCRPLEFNVFAFVDGGYAGTLSPVLMDSRTDGVLAFVPGGANPSAASPSQLKASFLRYAPTDPLCCPSRPATTVTYQIVNGVVVPTAIGVATPTTLPKTGGPPVPIVGGVALAGGLFALLLGRRLRRSPT
jgi:hypothetical protein